MKKSLQILLVLVALGIACGCATVGLGQGRAPIVGGYKKVATDDPRVQEAAEFAVSAQKEKEDGPLSLVSIEHAERQMVAGTKYRLCLKVKAADETDADEDTQDVQVVVFHSLKNKYSLTSWEEADCGESDSAGNHALSLPAASVTGVYENFTLGKGSGDLEGMRVVLVSAGSGYHAIVQIAQGGAEDPQPEFVEVNVKGTSVDFTAGSEKFRGRVTAAGLTLRGASGSHLLKRKPCSSFFR